MFFPDSLKIATVQISAVLGLLKLSNNSISFDFEEKLLTCLAESLKFKFDVLFSLDGEWGSLKNGSWTGVIGMVERNEVDMGLVNLAITEGRSQVVDFSFPYTVIKRTFVVKRPGKLPHLMGYIYPFTTNAWILCVLLIIAFTFLFQKVMFKNASIWECFLGIFGSVLTQGIEIGRISDKKRVVFGLWLAIASIVPFLYQTSFLSFVTFPGRMPGIKDFRDLSKAVFSKKYKCMAPQGTADMDLLASSEVEHLRKLGEIMKQNNWKYGLKDDINYLIDDSTALIISRQLIDLMLRGVTDTNIEISEDSFGVWNIAIALRKRFCCKKQLDTKILRILSGGLYKKWFDDKAFLQNVQQRLSRNFTDTEISLSLEDLNSSFIILFIGIILSFVILLVELFSVTLLYKKISKHFHKKQKM